MSLRDEILAKCTPQMLDRRDTAEIAAHVSVGRKKVVSHKIGEGSVSEALGLAVGPMFVQALRNAALATLPEGANLAQQVQKATLEQAWRLLDRESLDVGLATTRQGIDALVGQLPGFTAEAAAAIKALAERDAPVSAHEVNQVAFAANGDWLL